MKKQYKYETHMHTSQSSGCGKNTAEEMVWSYKNEGYTGVIITDHFFNGNSRVSRDLPWKDRIDGFCYGYECAKAEGEKIGLDVFLGLEASFNGADLILLGFDKNFLYEHEDLDKYSAEDFIKAAHDNNVLVVHAHPFREADYIPGIILFGNQVDVIEVYNTSHEDDKFNERALEYAQKLNLLQVSGSDAHTAVVTKRGGIILDKKANSIDDIVDAIKKKEIELIK